MPQMKRRSSVTAMGAASPVPRPSPAQRRSSIRGESFSGMQQFDMEPPFPNQRTGAASPVPRPSPAQAVKAKRQSFIGGGSFSGIQQSILELPLPMQRTNSSTALPALSTGIMRSANDLSVKMPQMRRSTAIAIMTSQQQSQIQDAANEDNRPVHRYSTRMNVFSLLLLALALVNIVIVTLNTDTRAFRVRGPRIFQEQEQQQEQQQSRRRRHLLEETTCKLFLKDTEYGPTPTQPHGHSREEWVCELPQEESFRIGGLRYVDIVDFDDITIASSSSNAVSVSSSSNSRTTTTTRPIRPTLISGESTMTFSQAVVDIEEPKMYVPHDAVMKVQPKTRRTNEDNDEDNTDDSEAEVEFRQRRNLIAKTGTLTALVIRVIDSNGVEPEPSIAQLENDVFQDDVSLQTQYEKCSYGKLQMQPFSGKTKTGIEINGGVVDVKIDNFEITATNNNRGALQQAAFDAAKVQLGDLEEKVSDDDDAKDIYDLVLFCMPPGTGNWLAYAFINHKYSFYNNLWCSSVSAQMHEVGHNMGLAHSGQEQDGQGKYDDQQGLMGYSYDQDDTNMCFNPAKSFQLGWYDNKVLTIDPLSSDAELGVGDSGVRLFTLNGVSDYQKQNDNAHIVLRLNQISFEQDYYIGYNRKDGINKDTFEDGNMITIVRKESGLPTEYGQSTKVAQLNLGHSHVIENFNGKINSNVEIKFIALMNGDATIQVVDIENALNEDDQEGTCATYTIELTTDNYPEDNNWSIAENGGIGRAFAISPTYDSQETTYTSKVCLPYNGLFKFVIFDAYKDGLCCGQGKGSYRGLDPDGNELFAGGENFEMEEQAIVVGDNPNNYNTDNPLPSPQPTSSPSSSPTFLPTSTELPTFSPSSSPVKKKTCKDKKGKIKWNPKKNKKKNCKWIAKKNKCDEQLNGEPLWTICSKACNRCDDL